MEDLKEYIEIKFVKNFEWRRKYLNNSELEFLNSNIRFYYSKTTTIKDLFEYINKNLSEYYNKINEKMYSNIKMKFLYRILCENKIIYIFDLKNNIDCLLKLRDLNNKINIFLTIFVEKGACIYNEKGIKFILHSNEDVGHNLPHIHIENNGRQAVISLLDGKVLSGGINNKKQKYAIEKILLNKESLIYKWNTMTNGQKYEIKNNELCRIL